MPETESLEAVQNFFGIVLNGGDMAALDGLSRRDVVVPQSSSGVEGFRRLLHEMRTTFPTPEYKIMDTVSQGEKVVVRFSAKATHGGRFMGIPATGRTLNLWGIMIFRFEGGTICEFWSLLDAQGVLTQLREQ